MTQAMKITEKYEFLTDIITSYDGTEQRLKLRQYPRHYLTYDYSAMELYQAQYLRGIMRARQTDMWYIPMWHNPAYLTENFVKDGFALKVSSEYLYNFDECEYICAYFKDSIVDLTDTGRSIVREVNLYTNTAIEVKNKIPKRLQKENTFIYPLRRCILHPTLGLQYGFSNGSEVALTFEDLNVKSKVHLPYTIRYDYYPIDFQYNRWDLPLKFNNLEVFFVEPKWEEDGDNQLDVGKNVFRMDNESGLFMYDLKNNHSYDTHSYTMYFETQGKINNLIKFFKRMCGRYKTFYMPTWANDLEITRDIKAGVNYIYTDFSRLYKFYLGNGTKKHIVIFTKDWKSYIYPVLSYTKETLTINGAPKEFGKLMLQSTITTALKVEEILMCSYFNLVRFDDDTLTLDYETNICARVNIVVKEVDE